MQLHESELIARKVTESDSRATGGDGAGAWTGPSDLVGLLTLDQPGGQLSSPGGSRRPETSGQEPGCQSGAQAVLHTGTEYPGLLQAGQRGLSGTYIKMKV